MNSCVLITLFCITFGCSSAIEGIVPLRPDRGINMGCSPGFHGLRCKNKCRYPTFGLRCERKCDCRQQLCHFINGCPLPDAICPAGFTGKYCDEQCKFPKYGYGCQQQCLCPKLRCSTVKGCKNIKPDIIHPNLKTKSSFAPEGKTRRIGVTEIQRESSVNNDSMMYEGFTLEIQTNSQRNNGSIKEEVVPELIENTLFTQPSQKSKVTWNHIAIISVGGMLAVLVIAHVIVSIINCVNVNRGPRHP